MTTNKIAKLLGLAGIAVAASTSTSARADTLLQDTTCTVTYVQYNNDQLVVNCSNTGSFVYSVYGSSWTGCSYHQTADSMKILASMAQAAFLSGRNLMIDYYAAGSGSCSSAPAILFAFSN